MECFKGASQNGEKKKMDLLDNCRRRKYLVEIRKRIRSLFKSNFKIAKKFILKDLVSGESLLYTGKSSKESLP